MKLKFITSPFRWYYIGAALRFMTSPWEIYRITHYDGYLANTKHRKIYEDYSNYRNSHKYNR